MTHVFSLTVTDDDGASSVADTVTITVNPPANAAPTANAGSDQGSVASGATVTLDGSGSSDSDGSIASYAWSRTGGTGGAITLSDATAQKPTFTADALTVNADSITYVFDLVVTDNNGTTSAADNVIITVISTIDTIAPTVSITGAPTTFTDSISFDVTIGFSEDVTEFDASDINISGGTVTTLSGSGSTYTASITTTGNGDLSLQVPTGAAVDVGNNANEASAIVTVSNDVTTKTAQQISDFTHNRNSNILNTMPDFGAFLTGNGGFSSKGFFLNLEDSSGVFSSAGLLTPYVSSQNFAGKTVVWYQFRAVHSEVNTSAANIAVGYIGAHRFVRPNLLIGGVLQADFATETDGSAGSSGSGKGFMIGPYIATEFKDTALRFEGLTLWGRSANRVSPTGAYTDGYMTSRWMARAKLSGSFQRGLWTIQPHTSLAYFSETQSAYTDSLANLILPQTITLGETKFGAEFSRSFTSQRGNPVALTLGVAAMSNFAVTTNPGSQSFPLGAGIWRSQINLGLSTYTANGWTLSFEGFLDGLGVSNYMSYGGTLRAEIRF